MKIPNEIWLGVIIFWGILSVFYRHKFRKMIYRTNDCRKSFQAAFSKEVRGLLGNIYPYDKNYIRIRNIYRLNLFIFIVLIFTYLLI